MLGIIEGKEMKERFLFFLRASKRANIEKLIDYLESTDFFIAPASSNYHGNYRYGLLEHSLNVYENLIALEAVYFTDLEQTSFPIIGLLHDICKSNFYILEKRNAKKKDAKGNFIQINNKAVWEEIETYTIQDNFPLGHGEKSVILLQKYIALTNEEIFCIRWHMMAYDDITKGYGGNLSLTKAINLYPSIVLTHMADLAASFLTGEK